MDTFSTIRFKIRIANRFRKFSIQVAKTHTEALEAMLNFFEWNDLNPYDNLGINNRINKRINAVIAILKNIEKHQTKPTTIMLQSLLEEVSNVEDEEYQSFEMPKLVTESENLKYYREKYFSIKTENQTLKNEVKQIILKLKYVKSNFGTNHYRIDINKETIEALKQKLD